MFNCYYLLILNIIFVFAIDNCHAELKKKNIPQIENIFKRYLLKEGIKRLAVVGFEAGSIFAMKRFFELYSLESKLPFFNYKRFKVGSILA